MSITSILECKVKPELVEQAPAILHDVLADTRAFAGNISVVVAQAHDDPTRFVAIETWESLEADRAYREWRASQESSPLAPLLAEPPRLTVGVTREEI